MKVSVYVGRSSFWTLAIANLKKKKKTCCSILAKHFFATVRKSLMSKETSSYKLAADSLMLEQHFPLLEDFLHGCISDSLWRLTIIFVFAFSTAFATLLFAGRFHLHRHVPCKPCSWALVTSLVMASRCCKEETTLVALTSGVSFTLSHASRLSSKITTQNIKIKIIKSTHPKTMANIELLSQRALWKKKKKHPPEPSARSDWTRPCTRSLHFRSTYLPEHL